MPRIHSITVFGHNEDAFILQLHGSDVVSVTVDDQTGWLVIVQASVNPNRRKTHYFPPGSVGRVVKEEWV
jgi:hypothetical protein